MVAKDVSRRGFLTAAAVSGAACVVGKQALPQEEHGQSEPPLHDVAIVGAGISGLVTARELVARGVENIVVLEARNRVGGRTFNHDIGNGYVAEGGGQWIGPTQTAIIDLCKELGIGTFPTYLTGNLVYSFGGNRLTIPYAESTPGALERQIDTLAATVPLDAPWNAPDAAKWDAMSLSDWAGENNIRGESLRSLDTAAALTLGAAPAALSFLYFLYYVHSAGSLHDLESMKGGAQDSRIEGGSQLLSLRMAAALDEKVRLNAAVTTITQSNDEVIVDTTTGAYRAKHVVMALMPGSCTSIDFEPKLPVSRKNLQDSWVQQQDGVKLNVVYDKPFWRDQGLNGMALSDGPVPFSTDNSPPDGSLGVILILTGNDSLDANPQREKRQILEALADLFGERALNPIGYHKLDWGREEFTAGCVSPLAPGVLTQYGSSLRASVGRIHWSGTETSEVWTGYMDGAVRSGVRAAAKVVPLVTA